MEPGEHRAPRSRKQIGSNRDEDYFHFCLDHAREYNRNWDYFEGMTRDAIEAFQRDSVHGHRPTWDNSDRAANSRTKINEAVIEEALRRFMHQRSTHTKPIQPEMALTEEQHHALSILDLSPDASAEEIKTRYRHLVKKHHPDVNNGCKQAEERFKQAVNAYLALKPLFADSRTSP